MTTYFKANYTGRAGGSFVGEGEAFTELTWTGGGRGQIIWDIEDGTSGKLAVALIAGSIPDNQTITQGAVTANVATGAGTTLLYPAYFRLDSSITDVGPNKEIDWTGPLAGVSGTATGVLPSHSCYFDGQTGEFAVGEEVTFSGGAVAEVIRITDQVGNEGEIELRFTTSIDAGLPVDGETITGDATGAAVVQGAVHPRSYTPLNLHRLLSDLNDDPQFSGNDDMSMLDATPSAKDTDQIVRLIGGAYATDELIDHMYGGSIAQLVGPNGDSKYSGLDVQVTSPNAGTRPVLIQFDRATGLDAILTDNYSTAWNPDSIAGNVRKMVKTRANGVDIDGRRVKGKLLEFGDSYFEGGTTLGDATTSLALFSSTDGNNQTAVGTVAGAPFNSVVFTEGFQTLNYNNGNGLTPFALSLDYGTASSAQAYERTKYVQRRGTAETLFGRNAQLVTGVNRNFGFDTQVGTFSEDEIIAWGTELQYETQVGNFTTGEEISFSPSGARARIYGQEDILAATGILIIGDLEGTPTISDTITGESSSATAAVTDGPGVTINSSFGLGLLIAFDDTGDNIYYQTLAGLDPVNNQEVRGLTSGATCLINGAVATRTINNQFIGNYTGTNFQTNFGIGIDPSDAILGDQNNNLLGVTQGVPNNQSGVVSGLVIGDRLEIYPWDGVTVDLNGQAVPDFDQLSLSTTLNGAAETSVVVASIPDNTPSTGWLRITLDSGVRRLVAYTSFSGSTFTIPATDFTGGIATSGNDVMIGYIAKDATGTQESYTAIYGGTPNDVVVIVRRGDNQPIVPARATPTFGATGFSVGINRLDDS